VKVEVLVVYLNEEHIAPEAEPKLFGLITPERSGGSAPLPLLVRLCFLRNEVAEGEKPVPPLSSEKTAEFRDKHRRNARKTISETARKCPMAG
jgi:hypothetical protein